MTGKSFSHLVTNMKSVPPENIINYEEAILTYDPKEESCRETKMWSK